MFCRDVCDVFVIVRVFLFFVDVVFMICYAFLRVTIFVCVFQYLALCFTFLFTNVRAFLCFFFLLFHDFSRLFHDVLSTWHLNHV